MANHPSAKLLATCCRRHPRPAQLLEPSTVLAVDDHIAHCCKCRRVLRAIAPVRRSLDSLQRFVEAEAGPSEHLNGEQLQAYAQDQADAADRELAEAHLAICPLCRTEARVLLTAASRSGQVRAGNGPVE